MAVSLTQPTCRRSGRRCRSITHRTTRTSTKAGRAFEQALKANKVRYEMHMYPNTQHAFHNDTTPRYDEAAAKLAWQRTVDFFNKHLRG
jgi:dienelactone hydrolase